MTPEQAGEQLLRQLRADPSGQIAETEMKLAVLDLDINPLQRVAWQERRDRLEALGVDVSNYRPPLPLHPSEFRTSHPDLTPEERLREEEQQLLDLRARIEERLAVLAA